MELTDEMKEELACFREGLVNATVAVLKAGEQLKKLPQAECAELASPRMNIAEALLMLSELGHTLDDFYRPE